MDWRSVIRGAQGNFDHLMGQLRNLARAHNLLVDDFDELQEFVQEVSDNSGVSSHPELSGVTPNQHHNQSHTQTDHDRAEAGDILPVDVAADAGTSDEVPNADHVHAHEAAHVGHDTIWGAKGDLVAASANDAAARLAVGTNGYVLTADSGQTLGVKWAASGGGGGSVSADGALTFVYPIDTGGAGVPDQTYTQLTFEDTTIDELGDIDAQLPTAATIVLTGPGLFSLNFIGNFIDGVGVGGTTDVGGTGRLIEFQVYHDTSGSLDPSTYNHENIMFRNPTDYVNFIAVWGGDNLELTFYVASGGTAEVGVLAWQDSGNTLDVQGSLRIVRALTW